MNDWSHLGGFSISPKSNEYQNTVVSIWRYNPTGWIGWYVGVGYEHYWKLKSGTFSYDPVTHYWWFCDDDNVEVIARLDDAVEGRISSHSGKTGTGKLEKGGRMPAGPVTYRVI